MNRLPVFLAVGAVVIVSLISFAEDAIDFGKVRRLHQKVRSGESLTPEEQAYYDRGKAARKRGKVPAEKRPEKRPSEPVAGIAKTSTGLVPLSDLTADQKYKGEEGGLYGQGSNTPPEAHQKAAMEAAAKVQPLDSAGKPSPNGKIVFLTHGMSNTTNESQQFIKIANADSQKNPSLILVDGAQGGIDSRQWVSGKPTRSGANPWDRLEQRIKAAGATPQQVQVVWMKHAVARVGQFGEFPKHAKKLREDTAEIVRMLKERFPNLQLAYISSRSYAGYAATELNPEPYAYESAFAVRWLIQDQIEGTKSLSYSDGRAPLLLWGPYLWSDGEQGRKTDDLRYLRSDYREDGTHPSDSGRQKIAEQLLKFFQTDPTAKSWFVKQ
jgi:hypothetical protein